MQIKQWINRCIHVPFNSWGLYESLCIDCGNIDLSIVFILQISATPKFIYIQNSLLSSKMIVQNCLLLSKLAGRISFITRL